MQHFPSMFKMWHRTPKHRLPKGMKGKLQEKGRNWKDQTIENGGSGTEHTWKMNGKREQQGQTREKEEKNVSLFPLKLQQFSDFDNQWLKKPGPNSKTHWGCHAEAKLSMLFGLWTSALMPQAQSKSGWKQYNVECRAFAPYQATWNKLKSWWHRKTGGIYFNACQEDIHA